MFLSFMFGQFVLFFLKKDFFKNDEMSKFYLINSLNKDVPKIYFLCY